MIIRPRDAQRSRVYEAEKDALGPMSATHPEVVDVQALVDEIQRSRWFKGRWPRMARIMVLDGRGRRRGAGNYNGFGQGEIKMPRWTRTTYYNLHEIAHILTTHRYTWSKVASHGPEFCSIYLALVGRWMGKDAADSLRCAYRRLHVKWRLNGKNG